MAVYLGSTGKRKIILDSVVYCLNTGMKSSTINNVLLSLDNYALKDSNGTYLIPKDSINIIDNVLLSSDNYILKDSNEIYLIPNFNC